MRKIMGLPASQAEISTITLAANSLIIHIPQWFTPKDVGVPFYVGVADYAKVPDVLSAIKTSHSFDSIHRKNYAVSESPNELWTEGVRDIDFEWSYLTFTSLGSVLRGAVHLISWNFEFPTSVELISGESRASSWLSAPLLSCCCYLRLRLSLVELAVVISP